MHGGSWLSSSSGEQQLVKALRTAPTVSIEPYPSDILDLSDFGLLAASFVEASVGREISVDRKSVV